jgi:hypothetical protein
MYVKVGFIFHYQATRSKHAAWRKLFIFLSTLVENIGVDV